METEEVKGIHPSHIKGEDAYLVFGYDKDEIIVYALYANTERTAHAKFLHMAAEEGWSPFEKIEVAKIPAPESKQDLVTVQRIARWK